MNIKDRIIKWLGGVTLADLNATCDRWRTMLIEEKTKVDVLEDRVDSYRRIAARQVDVRHIFHIPLPPVYTDFHSERNFSMQAWQITMRTRQLNVSYAFPDYEMESEHFPEMFKLSVEKMIEALREEFGNDLRRAAKEALAGLEERKSAPPNHAARFAPGYIG